MRKFNLANPEDICRDAGVEYKPGAPFQFTRGGVEYIRISDIYAWGSYYGITTKEIDKQYYRHQVMDPGYGSECAEALQRAIGGTVGFDGGGGILYFHTKRLTHEDIDKCRLWGQIVEVSIDSDLLYVIIQIK